MAFKRLLRIQIHPDTTTPSYYGSLHTRMPGVKGRKKKKKGFKAETDILHLCFPKVPYSTDWLTEECSPFSLLLLSTSHP